eukprot:3893949-Pyramimonas_sp.AAC.3
MIYRRPVSSPRALQTVANLRSDGRMKESISDILRSGVKNNSNSFGAQRTINEMQLGTGDGDTVSYMGAMTFALTIACDGGRGHIYVCVGAC